MYNDYSKNPPRYQIFYASWLLSFVALQLNAVPFPYSWSISQRRSRTCLTGVQKANEQLRAEMEEGKRVEEDMKNMPTEMAQHSFNTLETERDEASARLTGIINSAMDAIITVNEDQRI